MFIKLQVFWAEEQTEQDEVLGREPEFTLDYIVINSDYIIEYHPDDSGQTMISMLNGVTYRCPVSFDDFSEKYPECMARMELVISTEGEIQN